MPLSEFLQLARRKLESGQQKPTDLSSRPENDVVELVWENGQVMMQGQSNRVTRTLPSNTPRVHDTRVGNATSAQIGKFGRVESILNDISLVVPSGNLDLNRNDDMVSWLNYPIDDVLPQDYCSELLPEISGVTVNKMSGQNGFASGEKRSSCDQRVRNLTNGRNPFKVSSSKARLSCSWLPQQGRLSDPSVGSEVSDIISNNTSDNPGAIFGNSAHGRDMVNDSTSMKMERQNIVMPSNNSGWLNFSNFSRPATLVKSNLPNSDGTPPSVDMEKMEVKEKGTASKGSNPVKSTLVERLNSTQKDADLHVPSAPLVKSRQPVAKESKESFPAEITESLCRETSIKNDKPLIQSNTANSSKRVPDGDRAVEPMVASSSVGSGNSDDIVPYEQTHNSKRKFCDVEESECHSDDGSVGVKKPTPAGGGTGSKRSRASEVHNLSERRRRDRINEKMRALQELIPNCNKADKASMLDEAIEYLKKLQLQVQMMSMGAGLYMPPMMFPPGIQHIHRAHFSPMGIGMGMGMLNTNGGSPGCPIFPGPVYGHPSQGLHYLVPRAPLVPLTGRPPLVSAMGLRPLRAKIQNEVPSTFPTLNSEDSVTNKNSQLLHNAEAGCSINHRSNQLQARNKVLDQSAAEVQENNKKTTDVRCTAALSTTSTDIIKEAGEPI